MLDAPRIEKGKGVRGFVAFYVKRIVRRLTRWYVEPRFNEIRSMFEDQQRTIHFLRKEIDLTYRELSQLVVRLHELEEKNKTKYVKYKPLKPCTTVKIKVVNTVKTKPTKGVYALLRESVCSTQFRVVIPIQ